MANPGNTQNTPAVAPSTSVSTYFNICKDVGWISDSTDIDDLKAKLERARQRSLLARQAELITFVQKWLADNKVPADEHAIALGAVLDYGLDPRLGQLTVYKGHIYFPAAGLQVIVSRDPKYQKYRFVPRVPTKEEKEAFGNPEYMMVVQVFEKNSIHPSWVEYGFVTIEEINAKYTTRTGTEYEAVVKTKPRQMCITRAYRRAYARVVSANDSIQGIFSAVGKYNDEPDEQALESNDMQNGVQPTDVQEIILPEEPPESPAPEHAPAPESPKNKPINWDGNDQLLDQAIRPLWNEIKEELQKMAAVHVGVSLSILDQWTHYYHAVRDFANVKSTTGNAADFIKFVNEKKDAFITAFLHYRYEKAKQSAPAAEPTEF